MSCKVRGSSKKPLFTQVSMRRHCVRCQMTSLLVVMIVVAYFYLYQQHRIKNHTIMENEIHEDLEREPSANNRVSINMENMANEEKEKSGHQERAVPMNNRISINSFVETKPKAVTQDFRSEASDKKSTIVEACRHAWRGYKRYAWGHDVLRPLSKYYDEGFALGLTIIDSLDTLWLMDMKSEYKEARKWVAEKLTFDKRGPTSVFEVTTHIIGGLLSAFHLTSDTMYLEKANDLGKRLLVAFTSKIPYNSVDLSRKIASRYAWTPYSFLAEVTSIQLELNDLSDATHDNQFRMAAYNAMTHILSLNCEDGLCPVVLNPLNGRFVPGSQITLGARGDSYYECLLKQWIQSGKKDVKFKSKYITAISGIHRHLLKKTALDELYYVGEFKYGTIFNPKMEHLACTLPGTLALGVYHELPKEHMDLAEDLIETCYQMYARMASGLSPVAVNFKSTTGNDFTVEPRYGSHNLGAETVGSLYIMYQITKEQKYREYGWTIFQAINKHAKVSAGYVSIDDVTNAEHPRPGKRNDKMESFFISETLKYLYLLFSDEDILPLDKYVFNTEGHPLPIMTV